MARRIFMTLLALVGLTAMWATQPDNCLDECTGGAELIHVQGWAFDPDASAQSIDVHVYVYTDEGCTSLYGDVHVLTANVSRPDVNEVKNITGDHGFNADIAIADAGNYWVKVFAIDTGGDGNPQIGATTAVTVTATTTPSNPTTSGKPLPYTYGFENFDLEAEGWTRWICGIDSRISFSAHSGNYCFKFSITETGQSSPQYLISPEIDSEGRDYSVSFYYLIEDGRNFFQVGYSTTTNNISDFTWEDASEIGSWTLYEKELPSNVKYIAIVAFISQQVAFISQQDGGIVLDDFTFAVSGCLPPENLTASDITDQSATLTWTAPSTTRTVTGYAYQYKKVSESTWSDEVTTTPTFATISNLLPNTSYDFRVKALYAEGESLNYTTITILTDCSGSVSLPFSEDFENGMGCWRVVNGDEWTGIDKIISTVTKNVFSFWGDGPQYLISPQFNCTQDITVSFNYFINTPLYPKTFQVGYSTTTDDTSAFTWDTEVTATTGDYVKYEHNFPAGTKYIAVKYTANNGTQSLFIDDVSIFVDGVLPPAQVSASTIATQSATLTWDAADGATGYTYQFKKASDVSWSAEATTTETSVTLSNLTADTDYEFRVKAIYGSNYSFYIFTRFTTLYLPMELPYEQDFESGYGRWTMVDCYTYWTGIDDLQGTGRRTQAARDSNVGFQFDCYGEGNKIPQYLISPRFSGDAAITLSFYYRVPTNIAETIYVGYSTTTNDKDAFTFGDAITFNSSNWTKYEHTFPANARYFAIKYTSNEYKMFIDDFSFEEYSTYAKPTTIVLTALTETEAQLIWNDPDPSSTGWAYQYKKASDAAWSAEVTQTTNTVTLSGLTPNTNYNFRVKAIYGSNASNYATRSFQTDANMVDLPYSDGFENGMGGWRLLDCDGQTKIVKASDPHSGTHAFFFNDSDQHQYFISPHFAGGTPMKVSFYYKNYENYPALFQVGYTSSKNADITWVNQVTTSSGAWTLYETTVPAETQYVVICCRSESYVLYLDDFSFTEVRAIDLADNADNTAIIDNNDGIDANVILQGRTLYKDGDWNTLCLPFDVNSFTGTPLADAIVKELNATTSNLDSNGTLTLNFEDATSIEAGKPYIVKWQLADVIIKTAADWNAFAESVNGGNTYAGKTVRLMKDISVSTMVGTENHPFSGTFDGGGHTLNVTINASSTTYAAPFRTIGGGTLIKNLTVIGNVVGGNHCAGLVGHIEGSGVENLIWLCDVRTNIDCRSTHCGGVMGHAGSSTTYIMDTRFGGSITGENLTNIGVIWGWSDGDGTIDACLAAGSYCACEGLDMARGANNGIIRGNIGYKTQNFGNKGTYTTATGNALVSLLGEYWTERNRVVVPIIDPATPAEVINNPVFLVVTIDATQPTAVTSQDGAVSFVGFYSPVSIPGEDRSMLLFGAGNTLYNPNAAMTVGSCRAYFHINDPSLNVQNYVLNFLEKGDMNGDGQVTIADVPGLVNLILSGSNDPMGDINGDNRVSIADVTALVNHLKEN